jgi:chemotaxis family two-component system response regulator Rcp1
MDMLMVEDNRGDVVLVREAMTKLGLDHRMHEVRDGVEAIKFLKKEHPYEEAPRPDLIVLDLKLPLKNGREVLEEVEPNPDWRGIPIVLLSSSRTELEMARSIKLPAQSYMVKPSTFGGYVELVRSINVFFQKTGGDKVRTP